MLIYSFIPILNFLLLYLLSLKFLPVGPGIRRQSFLCAAVGWGVEVVAATELLNIFHALRFEPVLIFWLVSCLCLAVLMFTKPFQAKPFYWLSLKNFSRLEIAMLAVIAFIILLVGLVAFLSAPNSWDAVTYHMSRVYFWEQNHSVDHYPTVDWRQLFFQPWNSFIHLHFQILTGTDRFAALTSWFSFVGLIFAGSLIGSLRGLSRQGQIFSGLCVATIPTAIVEASGVRGDTVAAFWLVSFVSFLFLFEKNGRFFYVVLMGLILGLGALTKATFSLLCVPFLVWFIFIAKRKYSWPKFAGTLLLIGVLAAGINAGFFSRNMHLTGSVFGPTNLSRYGAISFNVDPRLWISNVLRTTAAQLATPNKACNRMVVAFVEKAHEVMHLSIVDDRNTFASTRFAMSVSTYEDSVTNFVQTVLILMSFVFILRYAIRLGETQSIVYICVLTLSYCVLVSTIKWSHHVVRYVLPAMVLGVLTIPLALEKIAKQAKRYVFYGLLIIFVATSIPYIFRNNLRRLVSRHNKQTVFNSPRRELYFGNDLTIFEFYSQAVAELPSECNQVGFCMGLFNWDYPLAVMLNDKLGNKLRIEHVSVGGFSPTQYPLGDFSPCAIIAVSHKEDPLRLGEHEFKKIREFSLGSVYLAEKNHYKAIKPIKEITGTSF